jgi:acetyl-CoA carboxylase carboxyltransferase component
MGVVAAVSAVLGTSADSPSARAILRYFPARSCRSASRVISSSCAIRSMSARFLRRRPGFMPGNESEENAVLREGVLRIRGRVGRMWIEG